MSSIEDLERWHRLWEQGIDPDHDCRTNAKWTGSIASDFPTVYGPCLTCGDTYREPDEHIHLTNGGRYCGWPGCDHEFHPAPRYGGWPVALPRVNWARVAVIVAVTVAYVVASTLCMTLTPLGGWAWALVPLIALGGGMALLLVGTVLWEFITADGKL
ncbi:hypothetical protein ACFY7C_19420 [Streptomyces sp. NPDC012769]|uniref:hypothetical protein n=1 Tax=Streptomyces sp. NPDC012769 TaxID=3364848 RepID=UPI00369CF3F4